MLLLVLAYLGGALTILSPCILPVLPFVFSSASGPFRRNGLPLLLGMAITFALVATLAAVGGSWVVTANQYGRWFALGLVALFALALLLPRVAERLTHPLVSAGSRLSEAAQSEGDGRPGASFVLGIATGLLWAPCAGPILGLVLTGAALQGANIGSTLLLAAYAAGAATSLAAALLLGGKVFTAMKRSLGVGEWVRRGLGGAMLVGVLAIGMGWDTGVLARISGTSTGELEQKLVDRLAKHNESATRMAALDALPDEGALAPLDGAVRWLNGGAVTAEQLRGKVVLIDFWTYSCINCLRTLPYVKAWEQKYRDKGLVVIGIHTPEFAFERSESNVAKALRDLGIGYTVAMDNNYTIWRAFKNNYWPAHYFVDAKGRIRHHHFGEGQYEQSERVIQQLLREAGATQVTQGTTDVHVDGLHQADSGSNLRSHETYLGFVRAANFASNEKLMQNTPADYTAPAKLALNAWGLDGRWKVGGENVLLAGAPGRIVYRFHARDLHLVLSPGPDRKPVRFKVTIDGKPPGDAHGLDVASDGSGIVTEQRLYQLVRQPGNIAERTFTIEFLDPNASAYAFTFG